ncbi:MAG: hypothetical protein ACO3JL_19565, partial [Myxococcota bacterium]
MNALDSRMKTLLPLGLVLGLFACAQGAGSCEGQGCGAGYEYPQSSLANGVAPVVRGVEARLTQAGVDFLQDRLPALVEGLADTLPTDDEHPAFFRLELTDPLVLSSSPRTALGVSSTGQFTRPTYVWIRKQPLLEELRFAFLEGAVEGIGAHVEELALGLDGRMYAKTLTTEAACSLYGTNDDICPPEAGSCGDLPLLTNVSFDVVLTPSIDEGAGCDEPAIGPCLRFDVDVANG